MRPRLLTIPALVAALLLLPAQVALGHAELDTATPGPGDEVIAPTELVATFTQDLDMSRTTMEVRDAAGATVAEGPERGDGPRELRLALPELAPGEYQVRWTSFSAEDSELERGTYSFTVLPAPSPTTGPTVAPPGDATSAPASVPPTPAPTPAATAAPSPSDGGAAALLPIGIAAVVLVAIGAWFLRRR